ncbi:MAG: hypothetical protein ACOC7V_13630, partial [Spirochaetota bacterium]
VIKGWGAGMTIGDLEEAGWATGEQADATTADLAALDRLIDPGKPRHEARQMKHITAALSRRYAWIASPEEVAETLLLLDDDARSAGPRTVLQEQLIDVYSACARPRFVVEEKR